MQTESELKVTLTPKQSQALDILKDAYTIELLFGGGAGGGKSRLGCTWGILLSLEFEGIRGLIGRDTLKSLKESTLLTFFDVCSEMGLAEGVDYSFNQSENIATFLQTGSTIYFKELGWLPSDPNYDRLGSTEFTWAFIEEANQVKQKAKNIVRSRLRYKLQQNGLIPKLLLTCNPSKGYLYTEFYKPSKEGKLPKSKRFLQALVRDNPFIDSFYIENLRGLDPESQERLLHGNWEYDDDPSALINFIALSDLFTNIVRIEKDANGNIPNSEKYLIVDVARFGGDRTVMSYWNGLAVKRIAIYTKLPTVPPLIEVDGKMQLDWSKPSVAGKMQEWRELYNIPLSHILADEDGVGGGVVDLVHCIGFMGGKKPFPLKSNNKVAQNFYNLRTQCYYKLAEYINQRKMAVPLNNADLQEQAMTELEQVKAKDIDKDGKLLIVPKESIKEIIGRSPDLADNLMMRMYFEFKATPRINWL